MNEGLISIICIALIVIAFSLSNISSEITKTNKILNKLILPEEHKPKSNEEIEEELREFMVNNNKIKAIKRYREITGEGLKESKEFIDELWERNSL